MIHYLPDRIITYCEDCGAMITRINGQLVCKGVCGPCRPSDADLDELENLEDGQMTQQDEIRDASVPKVDTGFGRMYVVIMFDDKGNLMEVKPTISKSGQDVMAMTDCIGEMCNLALANGATVDDLIDTLDGFAGEHPTINGKHIIKSIPDGIAFCLAQRFGRPLSRWEIPK